MKEKSQQKKKGGLKKINGTLGLKTQYLKLNIS